ncbi:MAG TPA: cytochrome c peroxidase, partial [Polyangiaceae bacterium]
MVEKSAITSRDRWLARALLGLMLLAISGWVGWRSTAERGALPSTPAAASASTRVVSFAPSVGDSSAVPSVVRDARVELGRKMFFDPALSEPAGTSCASCHDPAHGYAGNNGSTLGVARGGVPGRFAQR